MALLEAVHGHPAETETDAFAAEPSRVIPVGFKSTAQETPAWVTVTDWPEIVSVPVRDAVPLFAATAYDTVPAPVPFEPDVTVIHGTELDAVHPHVLPVVT